MVLAFGRNTLKLGRWVSLSSGQALVEYSLLLALVASIIVAVSLYIGGTGGIIEAIGSKLDEALD